MTHRALVGFLIGLCLVAARGVALGQNTVADVVERVSPSVVYIEAARGHGSGFVIAVGKHIDILTSYHVLGGTADCTVGFFLPDPGKKSAEKIEVEKVRLVRAFPRLDFGIIRLPDDNPQLARLRKVVKPLAFGDSQSVRVGERVICIGSPTAGMSVLGNSVGDGLISGRNRHIRGVPYFQTTAPVNPGNSGGPLMNLRGEVIGVVSSRTRGAHNIGFALPIHLTDERHYSFYLPEEFDEKAGAQLDRARKLLEQGKIDDSLAALAALHKENPGAIGPLVLAGDALVRKGKPELALVFYEKALAAEDIRYDDLIACVLAVGSIHGAAGRHREALDVFRRGLARDPTHAVLNRNIGIAHNHLGNTARALSHWTVSLNSDADQPWLRQRYLELTRDGN